MPWRMQWAWWRRRGGGGALPIQALVVSRGGRRWSEPTTRFSLDGPPVEGLELRNPGQWD